MTKNIKQTMAFFPIMAIVWNDVHPVSLMHHLLSLKLDDMLTHCKWRIAFHPDHLARKSAKEVKFVLDFLEIYNAKFKQESSPQRWFGSYRRSGIGDATTLTVARIKQHAQGQKMWPPCLTWLHNTLPWSQGYRTRQVLQELALREPGKIRPRRPCG